MRRLQGRLGVTLYRLLSPLRLDLILLEVYLSDNSPLDR